VMTLWIRIGTRERPLEGPTTRSANKSTGLIFRFPRKSTRLIYWR
jgi:hypothetical protein